MRHYLVVDDNRAFADNLSEILRDGGDEAVVVGNGESALAAVRAQRFDAMVTDMRMPVMGGAALVHEVRRIDAGLPAIVVTAYTQENDLVAAQQEGILAVLPKPVPVPTLLALLKAARRDGMVAVLEDDAALCHNLIEALRHRGFTAVTAASALDAERLGALRPFAALIDLRLPNSPAAQAARDLSQKFEGLKVLVMTGFPELRPTFEPAGVYLKPFDTQALLTRLDDLYAGARQTTVTRL
ncbi:MAG: response regulator [Myxococcaceae bacterium]|nr:response regulator [Myxococcaceae bacterium]